MMETCQVVQDDKAQFKSNAATAWAMPTATPAQALVSVYDDEEQKQNDAASRSVSAGVYSALSPSRAQKKTMSVTGHAKRSPVKADDGCAKTPQ